MVSSVQHEGLPFGSVTTAKPSASAARYKDPSAYLYSYSLLPTAERTVNTQSIGL